MPPRDWRVASDYAALGGLDPSSLAWEFLRRNPQYQTEYRLAVGGCEPHTPGPGGGLAPRWGLRFPGRSGARRFPGPAVLAR
ncbi:transcriptional regulator domain-containing protein [Phenylobacterium sp.]|uniref:transcriptional regulator domain-containing protein n=1 Tax=Phenylobacterium sp. TaxID=1871053 RepID=UPI003D2CBA03